MQLSFSCFLISVVQRHFYTVTVLFLIMPPVALLKVCLAIHRNVSIPRPSITETLSQVDAYMLSCGPTAQFRSSMLDP
ncbi:hypothetical protein BD769DRAFT_1414254 [Suillus cothurnatus]|nr:hypothetical protein BD769DRAFT_1414254 [Suillus cothurnatus]